MLSNEFIQNLSNKAASIFPAATSMQKEIESKLYELLQSSFSKLNLVTREEFDSQLAVLSRTQQTITELEAKITLLELEQQNTSAETPATTDDDQTSDN